MPTQYRRDTHINGVYRGKDHWTDEEAEAWDASHAWVLHLLDCDRWLTVEEVHGHSTKYARDNHETPDTLESVQNQLNLLVRLRLAVARKTPLAIDQTT